MFEFRQLAKQVYRNLPGCWTLTSEVYQQRRFGGARGMAQLDIMTSIGGKDLDVLQVMLLSLAETHPDDNIRFWLFYLNAAPQQLTQIQAFCDTLPNVTLHPVHVQERNEFALLSKLGNRPFGARFLWFVAHLYLPTDISRILYLDPLDIIVTDDLYPFLMQPLLGKSIAACREAPSTPPIIAGPVTRRMTDTRIERISKGIINSGAIVLNLDKFRKNGVTVQNYIKTATYAHNELGLTVFGDQGLFSLNHGSDYVQAHDRYNFRFHDGRKGIKPAVVHFAGRIPKPFHLRLNAEQERQILSYLDTNKLKALRLNPHQTIKADDLAYYRQWWDVCARTPVFQRIAPLAEEYAAKVLPSTS
ncbi:glycosyltransferase [Paracoccus sp. JM45]|uniref:glycosyltransferase family 8 protein n=1 Tax=Paracoccus sp. JM45 TaxID=2283626 RepID=UPI000E6D413A|nr:glycosyltransferase [Paracoccus sp. JM45]RJE80623.1 hypothetical protein DWB67_07125 [Paracoccus sp. JM45]